MGQQLYPEIDSLELKPWQLKKMGKRAAKIGDIYSAIDYFVKYLEHKPDKLHFQYRVAELYQKARDYQKAKEYYDKVYEEKPESFPLAAYYGARMKVMAEADYEGALAQYKDFKKKHKSAAKHRPLRKIIKGEMAGCEIASELMKDSVKVTVDHLNTSINKAHVEFSPLMTDMNSFIYAALKLDDVNYYKLDDDSVIGKPTRKFYTATRRFEEWVHDGEMEGPFNDSLSENGNGAFSPDGKRFYFTRCKQNQEGKMNCKIYWSTLDSGAWSEPEPVPGIINSNHWSSTQPTVGIDPKKKWETLYFVSDRPKSKGDLDIWYSVYDEKKQLFRKVKNCGSKINGAGKERTPHYDMDTKTLYFSSNSWPGLGGQDIFKSIGQLNKWTALENLKYPINSRVDDFYYTLSPDKQEGFLVSNRAGGVALKSETCCDDIYHFYYTQYVTIGLRGTIFELAANDSLNYLSSMLAKAPLINVPDVDFDIKDSLPILNSNATIGLIDEPDADFKIFSGTALQNAKLTLFLMNKETNEKIYIQDDSTDADGHFFFKLEQGNDYHLSVFKEGFFSKEIALSTVDILEDDTLEYHQIVLNEIPIKPIIVKNIYYPFDKAHLTDQAKTVIDTTLYEILVQTPHIIVEISSHTDSKGSHDYNVRLSQKRAESVVSYLIELGINDFRLVAKGYGEVQPITTNKNEDGSDNEAGRARNRRTEFKVIGTIEGYSGIIYEE